MSPLSAAGEIGDGADQGLRFHGLGDMRLEAGRERIGAILVA
jgi:hypothetical protein